MPTRTKIDFASFMRRLVTPAGGAESVTHDAESSAGGGCGSGGCGCKQGDGTPQTDGTATGAASLLDKPMGRRGALGALAGGAAATAAVAHAAADPAAQMAAMEHAAELRGLEWAEYFKGNFRLMTPQEQDATIARLERLAELREGQDVEIAGTKARPGVLFGYAFNISKCRGYRDCVRACVEENNQDRNSNMQYIRIFEMKNGVMNLEDGKADYFHQVPAEGHFYLGTQCFQCENPPCVTVCPVGATWKEPDGITVIDYDWCIGCRYCEAACPYWARRFNWSEPEVPRAQMNRRQHYLGNRMRTQGVMEKCTFCIQRTREGRQPACAEACPTGARIFGNLLDPNSEIRHILATKKVFRLKEDLGTEPKFWYFMD